jgi:hypothetical protein
MMHSSKGGTYLSQSGERGEKRVLVPPLPLWERGLGGEGILTLHKPYSSARELEPKAETYVPPLA